LQSLITAADLELVRLQCHLSVGLIVLARCGGAVGVMRIVAADAVEGLEVLGVGVGEGVCRTRMRGGRPWSDAVVESSTGVA
jgi:hypothetical protein